MRHGYRWLPLPLVSFDSDAGLGYGGRFEMYNYGHRKKKPYEYWLALQFFRTTKGVNTHRIKFDLPWIRGSRWRLSGGLLYLSEYKAPWYGLGGDAEYRPEYVTCGDRDALKVDPDICPDNPDFRGLYYYTYRSFTPSSSILARYEIDGPWQLYGMLHWRFASIKTHYGEKNLGQTGSTKLLDDLAADEPIVGLRLRPDGTVALSGLSEIQIGGAYDTRDHEPAPTSGSWHDLNLRVATPLLGGHFWYWGAAVSLRHYRALDQGKRLVLAVRGLLEVTGGDVPFYHLSWTGGIESITVLGGSASLRGLQRNRFVGKIKLVMNSELRYRGLTLWARGHRFDLGGMVGLDAGRAWRGWDATDPFSEFPVSAIVGFRGVYDESFTMAIDYGRVLGEGVSATYVQMSQMF